MRETPISRKEMERRGWVRSGGVRPDGTASKLSVRYTHPAGWVVYHCGHPTANWPYGLIAPDGTHHCQGAVGPHRNPQFGYAWRSLRDATDYVARVLSGELECRPGRHL